MSDAAAVSEIFDPSAWKQVPGFEDLTDLTYHRARAHGTVRVAFDRPDVLNAFRPHTVDELLRVLDHARTSADVGCVLHTHTRAGVAVSAQKDGVLPISQQSTFVLASLAYHDYEGVAIRPDEQPRLQNDLGDKIFYCLRNHGLLTVGRTIADAFLSMYTFESACQIQIAAQAGGVALTPVDDAIIRGTAESMRVQTGGLGGAFVWPTLLRQARRQCPGFDA